MKILKKIKVQGDQIFSFIAIFSMIVNVVSPFVAVFPAKAYAEDAVTETTSSNPAPADTSTDTKEQAPKDEPTTETTTIPTITTEPTNETIPADTQQGDILPDGASDYRPVTDVIGTETQQTQESAEPVTLPSSSEPAATEPSATEPAAVTEPSTTEPAPAVSSSEPATEPTTPIEAPKEYETLADGVEIKNSVESDWKVDGNKAETNDVVKVGVKYIFPLEKDVTITFTKLPKLDSDRTSLKIEKVKVSDLNLPDEMKTNAEFAYDVTTGMKEGDFKYDITLPKPENKEVGISYIEKSVEEAKNDIKSEDVKTIDDKQLEQKMEDSTVKINDLDHFTIFIMTYADLGLFTAEVTYLQGDTVYINSTGLTSSKYYKIDITEQDGLTTDPAAICTTGVTSLEGSYSLSTSASIGTNWKAEITQYDNSSNCGSGSNVEDTATATFEVKATSPLPLANPTISQTCGLDIALVIDNSNSIDSTELSQMKTALKGFVNALVGTSTQFSVTKFGTNATVVHAFTSNATETNSAIDSVGTGGGGTNWKEGISKARGTFSPDPRTTKPNLMIFASDGNPTLPNCGGSITCAADVNAAVTEANTTKLIPIRILALGIDEVDSGLSAENLKAISGHIVNGPTIMGSDVITTKFSTMAADLMNFASQTCGGTITVNKVVTGEQNPTLSGWHFTINGQDYATDAQGFTQAVPVSLGTYSVTEITKGTYTLTSKSCTKNGLSTGSPITNGVGGITVGADDIISCTFTNAIISVCGDSVVNGNEQCDNGTQNGVACTVNYEGSSCNYCSADCRNVITVNPPYCGDHVINGPEQCDDGNIVSGDGCSATCQTETAILTVNKVISSIDPSDPGLFNLKIDGTTYAANVGNGGSTGAKVVSLGSHTVSETAGTGTDLTLNYTKVISGDCAANGTVTLAVGENKTCTITNTRNIGSVTVSKKVDTNGDGIFEGDNTVANNLGFLWGLNGGPVTNLMGSTVTYPFTFNQDFHVNENSVANYHFVGWYTPSMTGLSCSNPFSSTLPAGGSQATFLKSIVLCNARDTGDLKVQKVVDDGSALTQWKFSLDGGALISANSLGIVDFGQVTTLDTHTITESGPNTYYFDSVSGANCTVNPVAAGMASAIVVNGGVTTCTFSNKVNRGSITIIKDATPNSDQDFNFVSSGNGVSNFTLDDDGDNTNTYSNTKSFNNLLPGYYSIVESAVTGWNQSMVVCDSTDGQDTLSIGSAGISLSANEHVTCTFTNTGAGKIKVIKNATGGDASFNFYIRDITGAPVTSSIVSTTGGHAEKDFINLNPGTYSVGETTPQSWFLSGASCVDQSGAPVGSTLNHNAIYSLVVNPGSEITCTFDNVKYGRIIVDKVTDPSGDPQSFTLTYKKGGTTGFIYLTDQATPFDTSIFPGVWEIAENSVSGWGLTNITCTDPDGQTVVDLANGKALADIDAGETVSCTFTNSKISTLTVTKIINPSNDPGLFNLFIDGNGIGTDVGNNFTSNPLRVDIGYLNQVSETAGTGTGLDDYVATYGGDCNAQGQISLSAGENKNCTITNTLKGASVALGKCNDLNGDGGSCDGSEPMLPGWTLFLDKNGDGILNNGETSGVTDANGMVYFSNVSPGSYGFCEVEQPGWIRTKPNASNCQPYTLNPGGSAAYYFANAKLSDIHGYKWNDLNGNGVKEENEPLLGDWRIFIDDNGNQTYDIGERTTLTQNSGKDYGWYWFTGLVPGSYSVCEQLKTGWAQTYPNPACHLVSLPYSTSLIGRFVANFVVAPEYDFGNVLVNPILEISKENNTGGNSREDGDVVIYTITVKVLNSPVENAQVTDLLPKGFSFVTGAVNWSVVSSIHGTLPIIQPTYASPGVWNLGDLEKDEIVTITYKAQIGSTVDPGVYPDLAWTSGNDILDRGVLGLAENPGVIATNFVGTDVEVIKENPPLNAEVNVKEKKEEKEVLGASTSRLPATGSNILIIDSVLVIGFIGGLLMLVGGIGMMIKSRKQKIRNSRMKKALLPILALGLSLVFARHTLAADSLLIARIEDPASPAISSFNLDFVVLDAHDPARSIEAQCWKKGPLDSDFVKFADATVSGVGGNANNCVVDNSVLTQSGTYKFKVEVSADGGANWQDSINTATVVFDNNGPDRPKSIDKDKKSHCEYEITFKTADDGQTTYVELFRDFDKSMNINNEHKIKTITSGPNEEHTYTDMLSGGDCDHTPYYAVVAFDASGNASEPRAETVVEKVTVTITKEEKTTLLGALTVPGGANLPGGGTTGAGTTGAGTGENQGQGTQGGSVLGENVLNAGNGSILKSFWFWLPIILVIIGLGGVIIKGKKKA